MTRPKFQRSPRFDSLESRELLSGTAATAEQQYMLQLVNTARTNPVATANWIRNNITPDIQATLDYYHVDLNSTLQTIAKAPPKPPLAWNSNLANAAQGHSQDMVNTKVQTHAGSDGSTIDSRIQQSGYGATASTGENAYAYAGNVDQAMQAFLLDWGVADQGHRRNLLQANVPSSQAFQEIGIGIARTNDPKFGPVVVTQDFARPAVAKAQLLGVAYSDTQRDGRYGIGEGQGSVQVDAVNLATGKVSSTQTSSVGGYQMELSPGQYQVVSSQNDKVIQSSPVSIGSDNVEVDFVLTNPWDGRSRQDVLNSLSPNSGSAVSTFAASTPAPAPTPTPTPTTTSAPVVTIAARTPVPAQVSTAAPTSLGGWSSWKANQA